MATIRDKLVHWPSVDRRHGKEDGLPVAVCREKARIFSGCDSRPATARPGR